MKAIKCIVSIVLGAVVCLVSACAPQKPAKPTPAPGGGPAATGTIALSPTAPPQKPPGKEKELPIREPILE